MTIFHLLPLIPLIPFGMAFVNGVLFGRRAEATDAGKRGIHLRAIGAVALSCLLSLSLWVAMLNTDYEGLKSSLPADSALQVYPEQHRVVLTASKWLGTLTSVPHADGDSTWGFMLDPLSCVMLLFVTFIGTLIHIFAVRYMDHDKGHYKFFTYLNLFMGSMLTLILGSSLGVLFVGWEGVGVCSYLLIGFYYDRVFDEQTGLTCADAGRKAFITNRVGDLFFASGLLILLANLGTISFPQMEALVHHGTVAAAMPHNLLVVAVLLLFAGATAKSAQIPLYVWLPDAMAGPTPVSALIHAATMVTAGIYMLVRLNFLTALVPEALAVVALTGALTAVFAASMGVAANDIKKVLAYSTVSQLGYMFLGVGVGAPHAGLFHVFTHAFFKALMFLGAGAVIYSLHHVQDIRQMGQLHKKLPTIHWTFLAGVVAIAGIFPFAGFWSKDEILWKALSNGFFTQVELFGLPMHWVGYAVYGLGLVGACITPFYMGRLYFLVFHNSDRTGAAHGHEAHGQDAHAAHDDHAKHDDHGGHGHHDIKEPDGWILWPLRLLAVGALGSGLLGMGLFPQWNLWEKFLTPILETGEHLTHARMEAVHAHGIHSHALEWGLAFISSFVIGLGFLLLARKIYHAVTPIPQNAAAKFPRLYALLLDKWRIDELYAALVIEPFYKLCRWAFGFDKAVVDGAVNGTATSTLFSSRLAATTDKVVVDGAGVNGTGWTVNALSDLNRVWQSGQVQRYAAGFTAGVIALVAVYWFSR